MPLRLFDTLTGAVRTVPSPRGRPFTLYVCGPTVYDGAHVGHARTYLYFDVVRRVLQSEGRRVRHVMNITDFEDKITDRAVSLGQSWQELARTEERKFAVDLDRLRILPPHRRPRASRYVPRMNRVVRTLEQRGRARWQGDSLLYIPPPRPDPRNFRIGAELARHVVAEGVGSEDVERKGREFLLWRRQLAPNASWSSRWGEGAPGWHVECYCMAEHNLGLPVDLHGGGNDLVFPHHYAENEVALAIRGTRFARHYLHTGFVTENGRKMSKSTGVLVALRPVLNEFGPDALRFYLLAPSYRDRLEWDGAALRKAAERSSRIARALFRSKPVGAGGTVPLRRLAEADGAIRSALLDGLRIGDAFAALDRLAEQIESAGRPQFPKGSRRELERFTAAVDARLGLGLCEAGRARRRRSPS
jgi:cysteinyl-tRNA synthetase